MIIGVDASKATEQQKTGLGNTIYPILLELQKIDKKNQYYLYTNAPLPKELLSDNFIEKLIPSFKFWHSIKLPLTLRADKPDAFFAFTNPLPAFAPKNTYVLLHDFASKFFPECYSPLERREQDRAIKLAIRKASKIVVTSEANKADLKKFYNPDMSKVFIAPLGFNDQLDKEIEPVKEVANLSAPFFLSVGRIEKRKNTLNIVFAFAKFKENTKSSAKLVLVGKNGYGFKDVKKGIDNFPEEIKKDIISLGFVTQNQLGYLYSKALCLVYPSLYEGFGFPALEAMSCGCPVITSNVPTIKEVAGKAALYVDPKNIDDISNKMLQLYQSISERGKLISLGKENIKRFSFAITAKKIHDTLNEE